MKDLNMGAAASSAPMPEGVVLGSEDRVVVLLVDDQAIMGEAIRRILAKQDRLEFHFSMNSANAVAIAKQINPTVILQDLVMPGVDGLDLVRQYRADPATANIPIIVLSTKEDPAVKGSAFESGANDYLVKFPDVIELVARIRYHSKAYLFQVQRDNAYKALQEQAQRLAKAREQIDADLAAAGRAQRALLPVATTGRINGCEIAQLFIPAQQLSGDMFNYFAIGNEHVGFYSADVVGHGVRSALVAATLGHIVLPSNFGVVNADGVETRKTDPAQLAHTLNRRFVETDYEDAYFTLCAGMVDCRTDTLSFCQAGHPHPLLIRQDGTAVWLGAGGLPVGLFADATWTSEDVPFIAGDRLIVHSDGITEAATPDGELYGDDRLLAFVLARRDRTVGELCASLAVELRNWMDGMPNEDDVTMIVIERT